VLCKQQGQTKAELLKKTELLDLKDSEVKELLYKADTGVELDEKRSKT